MPAVCTTQALPLPRLLPSLPSLPSLPPLLSLLSLCRFAVVPQARWGAGARAVRACAAARSRPRGGAASRYCTSGESAVSSVTPRTTAAAASSCRYWRSAVAHAWRRST